MSTFQQEVEDYRRDRRDLDREVLEGCEPPPCFGCKRPSTHVSDGITPAGYCAYQCDDCVPKTPAPLWGSDPGWQTRYIRIDEARDRNAGRRA